MYMQRPQMDLKVLQEIYSHHNPSHTAVQFNLCLCVI